MTTWNTSHTAGRSLSREIFVSLLDHAFSSGHYQFLRQAALSWLAAYPGDLEVNLLYAKALLKEGQPEQASPILNRITQADPEWLLAAQARLQADELLRKQAKAKGRASSTERAANGRNEGGTRGSQRQAKRLPATAELKACIDALEGGLVGQNQAKQSKEAAPSEWSQPVYQVRQILKGRPAQEAPDGADQLEQADLLLNPALTAEVNTPLVAVTHMRLLRLRQAGSQALRNLAEHYHRRWPDCIFFQLILAEALIESGETDRAVAYLHRAAANDVAGQVPARIWTDSNPYGGLWPKGLAIQLETPIPASLAAIMGWNQLPQGAVRKAPVVKSPRMALPAMMKGQPAPIGPALNAQASSAAAFPAGEPANRLVTDPETLVSIQHELERVAERLSMAGLTHHDGRFPVYVILSTRRGMEKHYGQAAATELDAAMQQLAQAVQNRRDWHAIVFYADEGLAQQVKPARYNDPWSIKLALADLDKTLAHKGEMIGAVLIVGGPEIVPFHHLPNPVDDIDDDVPSDNPYGTRDENYFIPEWPVGRLPGGKSSEAVMLRQSLSHLAARHAQKAKSLERRSWVWQVWQTLSGWLHLPGSQASGLPGKASSFGYTAAIWRRASAMVFRPIGQARALRISPPVGLAGAGASTLPAARLGYFNLHGLVDAVEWYGQSDPSAHELDNGNIRDYPVAVRPQDVINSGRAPEVVFSEACYGAHIFNKGIEEALALKFLQAGSQAVAGSTCTAYGSINTPLTAADLLGHSFWDALRQGAPAGDALRRAKLALAREMHRRQGYLDGEDQKTLISFVLYGDPLAQPLGGVADAKSVHRPVKPPKSIRTVCDRSTQPTEAEALPPEMTAHVKKIVEQYLPGMQDARISLCQEHSDCDASDHNCPTKQLHQHSKAPSGGSDPRRKLVVLSKTVPGGMHTHHHYARLTLDEQNQLVKMVVSR